MSYINGEIDKKLEKDVRKVLKIPVSKPIPPEIKKIITKESNLSWKKWMERFIGKRADKYGKSIYSEEIDFEANILGVLQKSHKAMDFLSTATELTKILKENAEMLFKKRKALETAGFSPDEAFQLILAEVQAKKSK